MLHHAVTSVIYTFLSEVHPINASLPIFVTLLGMVMLIREAQYLNALSLMVVPLVIITVFKFVRDMLSIANVGIVASVILSQIPNALSPMLVTLSGIVTLVRE